MVLTFSSKLDPPDTKAAFLKSVVQNYHPAFWQVPKLLGFDQKFEQVLSIVQDRAIKSSIWYACK